MPSLPFAEEPIAIIGSSCRFPGSCSSPSKLWELLRDPRDVVRPFDAKRFNLSRFYHPNSEMHGATDVKGKSYLLEEDNRLFDAGFFAISPVEAAGMDPQQRLLLETTYEACESAGVTLEQLRGSLTSVHVGVMTNDYAIIQARDTETLPKYNATGTANSILSNRVSYVFDLKGASATIDTACSSSLVALHHAVQGLRSGDSTMAVVGGTNLILEPTPYIAESKLHMLSPDSQSRMWDKTANGYARGEGIASLLLKPLSAAQRDGDPIQGVIRATGVNSDGTSPGITMPFAPSQAALIRHVYRQAGLDPLRDPPQYFECHGTGTQAGDPVEARAVFEAFYRDAETGEAKKEPQTLHVGSVKTVIGHLEGCAGLAGVIKVLLALKHRTIPPNMHFNELNPKIAPYYGEGALVIPTRALPWPQPPAGCPMRASVNSFGFGGTNAHAIIESAPERPVALASVAVGEGSVVPVGSVGPLLLSASSGTALLRSVQAHVARLHSDQDVSLEDVSWVLQTRRTTHRVRAAFAGATQQDIVESMEKFVERHTKAGTKSSAIGHVARLVQPKEAPGTLGVFTGQGAQWATMGIDLLNASPLFRQSLEACEAVLRDELLPGDAPAWSLLEELAKDKKTSRVGEAVISQPICTAVQVALVDVLAAAGVHLDAVVGHSSGEIAATYAAGIISRKAAMQIAFYRGHYAHLCRGPRGERGGMLAVGLSMAAATRFCCQPAYEGRLVVAASNGPQSCTLSGDVDAVVEAKQQLDGEQTFARQLLVDTAYHSHHVQACAGHYLRALAACDIAVSQPRAGCVWNSSVRGDTQLLRRGGALDSLKGPYWAANMLQTVKFSQAIESSIWHGGPWDLALEIGPHAALKGPTEQTLKAAYGAAPPYASLLQRNTNDVAAFQAAIGLVWSQLGPTHVDFAGYRTSFGSLPPPPPAPVLASLPRYSWDHDKVYWRESRTSARYRTSPHSGHELLGRRVADDNERELRWRNVVRLDEITWLRGHSVLGQVLLPGAAYVSIAAEAAQALAAITAPGLPVCQIVVADLDLLRPLVVPDTKDGVETLFTVSVLSADSRPTGNPHAAGRPALRASFAYYVCQNEAAGTMMHTCSGSLTVHFGRADDSEALLLPQRPPLPHHVVDVEREPVYDMFRSIGLDYTGAFDAITHTRRCLGYAAATAVWPTDSPLLSSHSHYVLHPAILDVAFQSLFVAHVHPSTKKLKSALLPAHIDRVTINVENTTNAATATAAPTTCNFDAWVVTSTPTKLDGDITIYDVPSDRPFVQVEGLCTRSAAGGQSATLDRNLFLKTVHRHDASLGGLVLPPRDSSRDARTLRANVAAERLALFYIQRALGEIKPKERLELEPRQKRMLEAFERHVEAVRHDESSLLSSEWIDDSEYDVLTARLVDHEHPNPDALELKLVHAAGAQLAQILRGHAYTHQVSGLSEGADEPLNLMQYKPSALQATNYVIGQLLKQITFKFPRCNILELSTGTGNTDATRSILDAVDNLYDSFTYTSASSDAFAIAAAELGDHERILYQILNMNKALDEQGFSPNKHHIVVAAHTLSAYSADTTIEQTLQKARSLLCPGGYLVLSETTGTQNLASSLFSGRESTISPVEWHNLLRLSGFSGVETIFHDHADESRHVHSCIVSRAVTDDFLRLARPLAVAPKLTTQLLIIGGRSLYGIRIMDEINQLLPPIWQQSGQVKIIPSIDELDLNGDESAMDVLCLHDVDGSLFAKLPFAEVRLQKLQQLLMSARNLVWVTDAGVSSNPRASMIRGVARVVPVEMPHLTMQVLGLELKAGGADAALHARRCVEGLWRLQHAAELKKYSDHTNMLWTNEPEYEVLSNGTFLIPRMVQDTDLDERHNAKTRSIVKAVDATNVAVHVTIPDGSSKMALQAMGQQLTLSPLALNGANQVNVSVKYTIHIPSHSRDEQGLYLFCGQVVQQQLHQEHQTVMGLSRSNASKLLLDPETLAYVDPSLCTPVALEAAANELLRHALVSRAQSYAVSKAAAVTTMLILEPEQHIAEALKEDLTPMGLRLYSASSSNDAPNDWIYIHANMSKRMAVQCLPSHDVDLFVDCSQHGSRTHGHDSLQAGLPPTCKVWKLDAELLQDVWENNNITVKLVLENASMRLKHVHETGEQLCYCTVIAASNLAGADSDTYVHKQYVTDWCQQKALPLTVQSLDQGPHGLLRPDRTYLLVGGSGGLGLSLCQWMIRRGARHIAITSRNPKVDPGLQKEADRAGASVRMLAMDATRRDQVVAAVNKVRETMPPIAGVCNLSMVLHDKMFLDMSARQLNGTLEAKVLGTEILDGIFSSIDADAACPPLDFLIFTSSTASTVGNIGQANYHAANLFMAAVAERRRSRGLAASVIHIGWVADTGYVTRSDRYHLLEEHFRSMRFVPLSETDVQDAFAQAIRASTPQLDSGAFYDAGSHDITMGLEPPTEPMQSNQENKAIWVQNPRLLSLSPYSALSNSSQQLSGTSASNVREQVDKVDTEEAAVAIVAQAFATKLEIMLQLPVGSVQADLERPIIDLGIDSLVATEIRMWFLKDLDADVGVVSILGGDTVLQICATVAKKWLAERGSREVKKEEVKGPAQPVPAPAPAILAPAPEVLSYFSVQQPSVADGLVADASSLRGDALSSTLSATPVSGLSTPFTDPITSGSRTPLSIATSRSSSGTPEPDISSTVVQFADEKRTDGESSTLPAIIREEPMSAAQSRIWFASNHLNDPAAYNTAFHYRVQGHIGTARLRRALQQVVNHHECLRTCFYARLEDGHPMQGVLATSALEFITESASDEHAGLKDPDITLQNTLSQFKTRVWDLKQGRTMAFAVLGRSATEHDLVIGYHHILMDGWSLALFLRDLDKTYRLQPIDTLDQLSYIDYSLHQLAEEKTSLLDTDLAFWRAEFDTLPDTLPLLPMARGLDRSTLNQKGQEGSGSHYVDFELSPAQLAAQKDLCQRLRISPFHLYLALFQVLLARLSNTEDLCVGVVDANRRDRRFWDTVGCFVNLLPLRSNIPTTATFADVATGASRKAMEIFSYGTVPFDRILDQTRAPRAPGTNPLFQAAINYRSGVNGMDMWNLPLGDDCRMQLSTKEAKEADNPYDISLGFIETQAGCLVQMWCLTDLYGQDACRTMLLTYLNLLEVAARDPHALIADMELHDAASVDHALQMGKGPEKDFSWPKTLSQRIQEMCNLYPTQKAITDASGTKLLYAQLATRICYTAQQIVDAGGAPEDRIAVLCEPSTDGIVAMLAILHMGGVYVPLDISLPAVRHADMVRGCEPKLLLCHQKTADNVRKLLKPFTHVRVVRIKSGFGDIGRKFPSETTPINPDAPAVLLFTSGSTGTPKGILLTQANFANHIALKTHEMQLQQESVLQQSSLGFDMSLIQIFSALANGGHLVIAGREIRRDPVELVNLIAREGISMTIATPTEYLAWTSSAGEVLQKNKAWRFAFSGGEPITRQLKVELRRLGMPDLRLTNCYGPTEITAAATFHCVSLDDEADTSCLTAGESGNWAQYAVGKVLPNYSICVVDATGHPLPSGHIGEICIGGAGVAIGYLNQPEQTAAKFVPEVTRTKNSRRTMYRTGDKGRLLSDGTLLYLGRLDGDTQIKLRGLRIELQEVEAALLQASEGVLASAIVSLCGDVLIAHATLTNPNPDSEVSLEHEAVQQILSRIKLPQAFIPATICVLPTMPRTSNGKLDRKAVDRLPLALTGNNNTVRFQNSTEKMTVREGEVRLLWERVLPTLVDVRFGPSSDFFLCGGNSLLLMKLQKVITETTGLHVTTRQLYEDSTLRAMTRCIFDQRAGDNSNLHNDARINWDVETSVPDWLQVQVQQLSEAQSVQDATGATDGIEILLTGATSFLGGHLLESLLQSPNVRKVHCIAISIDDRNKLPQGDSRVACYSGSLLSPTLGLTAQERKTLEQTVHIIVHAGANGHCLNRFASLRAPNLQSLHYLASLALPRSIPLMFLSSSRAVLLSGNTSPKPGSLKSTPPTADGKDGYTASKWAGEVFLENLVAQLNGDQQDPTTPQTNYRRPLRVAVHRPCTLVSPQAPNSDAMNGVLRYSLAMRCAPRLKRADGYLDFGPLDAIISEITAAALDLAAPTQAAEDQLARRAEIHFRHHSGGIKSPMSAFRAHLEKVYGGRFDELDMEEWIVRAGQEGLDPLIVAYIEALLESGMPMVSPYMGEV